MMKVVQGEIQAEEAEQAVAEGVPYANRGAAPDVDRHD
jgi:hypothetical protein